MIEELGWTIRHRKRKHRLAYLRFMVAQSLFCIVLELILLYNITCARSRYIPAIQYIFLAANYCDMYFRSTYNPSFLKSSFNVLEIVALSNMFLLVTIVCFSQYSPHHHMFTGFQILDMFMLLLTFLRYVYRAQHAYRLRKEQLKCPAYTIDPTDNLQSIKIGTNQEIPLDVGSAQVITAPNDY